MYYNIKHNAVMYINGPMMNPFEEVRHQPKYNRFGFETYYKDVMDLVRKVEV
jgi:hypothetical protein